MNLIKIRNFIVNINDNDNYIMNNYERYAPFIILFLLLLIILILKDFIRHNSKLEKNIRLVFSFITGITISFYYIGNWLILGVDINNLPFHLCYLCTILSIILALNKNKKIFNFLLVCGVIGGLSSFISIDLSLSSSYFKYYKFTLSHIAIIILPIYFIVIHNYKLKTNELLEVFIQMEILSIGFGIFNSYFKTNYFFVSFTDNFAAQGTILEGLGNGYKYFINLQIVGLIYFFTIYIMLKIIEVRQVYQKRL
ncbi:TIGR02206 family membrane protein [Clostridium sp. HCS.1]|uniref:TMEM164 family acyltransferase n=1 Tax=Clostridium sp. HCS.1 TaxID=3238594 RepID=UPI003A0FE9DF